MRRCLTSAGKQRRTQWLASFGLMLEVAGAWHALRLMEVYAPLDSGERVFGLCFPGCKDWVSGTLRTR